jgi:hypothetical protein
MMRRWLLMVKQQSTPISSSSSTHSVLFLMLPGLPSAARPPRGTLTVPTTSPTRRSAGCSHTPLMLICLNRHVGGAAFLAMPFELLPDVADALTEVHSDPSVIYEDVIHFEICGFT